MLRALGVNKVIFKNVKIMKLSEVKKGDKIWIIYGYSAYHARVIQNFVETKFMLVKLSFWGSKKLLKWSAYNFEAHIRE